MIMSRHENFENIINTAIAVYKKNRTISVRAYPLSHMVSRIVSGLFTLIIPVVLYYFAFDRTVSETFVDYSGTANYITFVVIGAAVDILSFATLMNVGRCLILEIREGTLDTFLLSPASRGGYYIGAYFEQLGRSLIEFLVVLVAGVIVGARIGLMGLGLLMLITLLSSISFFSVAIFVSTVMVYTRDTFITQNTIAYAMELLCGVFFPTQYLPSVLRVIAEIFPMTSALRIYRSVLLNGNAFSQCCGDLIHVLILSILYSGAGYFLFRKREKKIIF